MDEILMFPLVQQEKVATVPDENVTEGSIAYNIGTI